MSHPTIGILGGGQLGRMLQEQATLLNVPLLCLDAADCPLRQINSSPDHVTGSFRDPVKIRELARKVDVLTVEIEHINTAVLEEIATIGVEMPDGSRKKVPVHPAWETLKLIQDKFAQKEHFKKAGIPVAEQVAVESGDGMLDNLKDIGRKFGYPFYLKARKESYDGRGNYKVDSEGDLEKAVEAMKGLDLYAERFQPFVKELAVMVIRTEEDNGVTRRVVAYPAVETVHEDSICANVFYPPREVEESTAEAAKGVATDVVHTLKGRGVFAVEMFVLKDGSLIVNEVAPRPHNSGHYTIEALPQLSQYRAQLLSILDLLPPQLTLQPRVSSAIMVNILGGANPDSHLPLVNLTTESGVYSPDYDSFLHLYGKSSKPSRKIGHITLTSYNPAVDLVELAEPYIRQAENIRKERLAANSAALRPTATTTTAPSTTSAPASTSSRDTKNPLVIVTMGSDSDLHVLTGAFEILEKFKIPYDFTITSAHRTPVAMSKLAVSAASRGVKVLIAAAGGAAALPGMLASETVIPVIGVPVKATHLDGMDSLLSIVQMPRGCPVATVGINNSTNAGLLAVKILGTGDKVIQGRMGEYMEGLRGEVEVKAEKLASVGWKAYLGK